MAFRPNQQLRDDIWDYRKTPPGADQNILSFSRSTGNDYSATALGFVHQAAEIFSGMENHAREAEARAGAMCKSLTEKLALAEKQRDASERGRREIVQELNGKLQEVSRALQQAQSRIANADDRVAAAEYRAQAAELQLYKANQELAAIEKAIRRRMV